MTDLSELNNTSVKPATPAKPAAGPSDEHERELAHRRMEEEAMKAAKRAGERENRDEKGNDEFKNIGPV